MTTINTKTTKKGLVDYLKEVAPMLKGKKLKALADSVAYTMKKFAEDSNAVLKDDLLILAMDIQSALTPATLVPLTPVAPVENSLKPVKKDEPKDTKTDGKKPLVKKNKEEDEKDTEETAKELMKIAGDKKKTDKKDAKADPKKDVKKDDKKTEKAEDPKKEAKKPLVKSMENKHDNPDKAIVLAEQFPAEFEAEGVGKLKVDTTTKTMEELFKAVDAGKNIVLAMYWTKRHLKQFPYDLYQVNAKGAFKEFPNDLDLAQLIYVSEDHKVAYAVSAYSEVVYTLLPKDLEMSDGLRYTNGIEYNIYEIQE